MAPGGFVDLARPGQHPGEFRELVRIAAPEGADRVAELVVPLAPAGGEAADPVAAFAEVPGFGDELHAAEHGILPDRP